LEKEEIEKKGVRLGRLPRNGIHYVLKVVKKTLILDLDETMIHCDQLDDRVWQAII